MYQLDIDDKNLAKIQKHGITLEQVEEFFASSFRSGPDLKHSQAEQRYFGFGRLKNSGRYIIVIYTIRRYEGDTYVRPISARYMHKKEVIKYEEIFGQENS